VLRTKADCLRLCAEGPILLIWPEGIVYGSVSPERIERILREHVIGATPIEPWIVKRQPFAATLTPPINPSPSPAAAPATAP
jgi:(2Fe-2S) ferredoxin